MAEHERRDALATARRKRRRGWRLLRDVLLIALVAVVVSFILKTFVVRTYYVPSTSMSMTLRVNDRILVNQLEPQLMPIERGDIVVFVDPGGWLPAPEPEAPANWLAGGVSAGLEFVGLLPTDSNDHLVKRVIGLPGDTIICCTTNGLLKVNGVALDEPYTILLGGATDAAPEHFEVTVPEGSLWVMGDNRFNSGDSVAHLADPSGGFVPVENVVGRAVLVTWPAQHWTWLDNHPDTFTGAARSSD